MKTAITGMIIMWSLWFVATAATQDGAHSAAAGAREAERKSAAGPIPTIDLRDHDFNRDGLARIDGEWAIFWNRFIAPDPSQPSELPELPKPDRFSMPGTWNSYERDEDKLEGMGYASFAVRVLLPSGVRRGALRIPPASTAYRLWVNGQEVAASGDPGIRRDTTTPGRVVRNPVFETATESLLVVMHVANFDHRVGGMWRPMWIGAAEEIAAYDIIDISYDLLLLGICLAFAAYNLLIYLASSRRSVAPLLFALFFVSVSVRVPTLGAVLATRALPGFPWHMLIFIEYMTGHLIVAFFCTAVQLAYPRILGAAFRTTVIVLMSGFSAFLVVAGVTRYSLYINIFVAVAVGLLSYLVLRLAWAGIGRRRAQSRHKRSSQYQEYSHARFGLLAALVVLGVVVSEWAHFSELVLSRDATPLGVLLGILSAPPVAQATTHLAVTSVTLLVVLTAASLLMYKVSDGLFGAAAREASVREAHEVPDAVPAVPPPASAAPADADAAGEAGEVWLQPFRVRYSLTHREAEIAAHVAEGLSNKEIAAVLFISEATVRTHIYRIFKKTSSQNRTELSKTYFSSIQV